MPVEGVTTQKEDQVEEEETPQEPRVSQIDSIGEDREELPWGSTARVSGSMQSLHQCVPQNFRGSDRAASATLSVSVEKRTWVANS